MAQKKKAAQPQSPAQRSIQGLDLGDVERLLQVMAKYNVAEMEWENPSGRLSLRTGATDSVPMGTALSLPVAVGAPAPVAAAPAVSSKLKQILSPFVGTFYRAPSPTSEIYVREGQSVKRGAVLCIIEAMKLMNEIEAEVDGTIVSVLVENGQPVEFGEPLFSIELDK